MRPALVRQAIRLRQIKHWLKLEVMQYTQNHFPA